jgi:hypothetical protein
MRYSLLLLLPLWSSPILAHPGHGTMPSGEAWLALVPLALIAAAGLLGYRRYLASKDDED